MANTQPQLPHIQSLTIRGCKGDCNVKFATCLGSNPTNDDSISQLVQWADEQASPPIENGDNEVNYQPNHPSVLLVLHASHPYVVPSLQHQSATDWTIQENLSSTLGCWMEGSDDDADTQQSQQRRKMMVWDDIQGWGLEASLFMAIIALAKDSCQRILLPVLISEQQPTPLLNPQRLLRVIQKWTMRGLMIQEFTILLILGEGNDAFENLVLAVWNQVFEVTRMKGPDLEAGLQVPSPTPLPRVTTPHLKNELFQEPIIPAPLLAPSASGDIEAPCTHRHRPRIVLSFCHHDSAIAEKAYCMLELLKGDFDFEVVAPDTQPEQIGAYVGTTVVSPVADLLAQFEQIENTTSEADEDNTWIDNAECVIALITPNYVKSLSCLEELDECLFFSETHNHFTLQPILIQDTILPAYLQLDKYHDARFNKLFQALWYIVLRLKRDADAETDNYCLKGVQRAITALHQQDAAANLSAVDQCRDHSTLVGAPLARFADRGSDTSMNQGCAGRIERPSYGQHERNASVF